MDSQERPSSGGTKRQRGKREKEGEGGRRGRREEREGGEKEKGRKREGEGGREREREREKGERKRERGVIHEVISNEESIILHKAIGVSFCRCCNTNGHRYALRWLLRRARSTRTNLSP